MGFRAILDNLDFCGIHLETILGKDKAEILDGVSGEVALVRSSEEAVFAEASEHLTDMLCVLCGVVGVYEDVVKVDDDMDI